MQYKLKARNRQNWDRQTNPAGCRRSWTRIANDHFRVLSLGFDLLLLDEVVKDSVEGALPEEYLVARALFGA